MNEQLDVEKLDTGEHVTLWASLGSCCLCGECYLRELVELLGFSIS